MTELVEYHLLNPARQEAKPNPRSPGLGLPGRHERGPDRLLFWHRIFAANLIRTLPYTLVAAATIVAATVFGILDPGFGGDSPRYLSVGKNILFNGCVSTSDPILGTCIPHWGGNQFPGYPLVIAFAGWMFDLEVADGLAVFAVPVITVQASLLGLSVFRLCLVVSAYLKSPWVAVGTGLMAGFSPLHFAWSRWILTECLATALAIWLLAEIIACLQHKNLRILPLAVPLVASFFVRYDGITLCAAVAVLGFCVHDPWTAIRRGLAIAIIVVLPVMVWSARNVTSGLSVLPMADYGVGHMRGQGYYDWVATWETDLYRGAAASFPLSKRRYSTIRIDDGVFADAREKAEVYELVKTLSQFDGKEMPVWIDRRFAEIASIRRNKYPFETWLGKPLVRALNIWVTTVYSYGWRLELGDDVRKLVLAGGWRSAIDVALEAPAKIAGKLALALYHISVLGAFVMAAFYCGRQGATWRVPYYCVAAYVLLRTVFVVQIGQSDPRLSIEPYALMQCVIVMALAWPPLRKPSRRANARLRWRSSA
jgi:hypothetical protein